MENKYYEDFRLNMKYYRDLREISQSQLAILSNCSNGMIGNIEAGKAKPSFDMIIKIAEALKIHPADLFFREASVSKKNLNSQIRKDLVESIEHVLQKNIPC